MQRGLGCATPLHWLGFKRARRDTEAKVRLLVTFVGARSLG